VAALSTIHDVTGRSLVRQGNRLKRYRYLTNKQRLCVSVAWLIYLWHGVGTLQLGHGGLGQAGGISPTFDMELGPSSLAMADLGRLEGLTLPLTWSWVPPAWPWRTWAGWRGSWASASWSWGRDAGLVDYLLPLPFPYAWICTRKIGFLKGIVSRETCVNWDHWCLL
jgi:hypothetical protein